MPDILTPVLGLDKQTIGGNRLTWGGILNNNFDTLEAALAGIMSKVVTGGSVTLLDSERRNRVLQFIGALSGNQTIVVSNLPSVWLVQNATTGSFTLSFTAGGNTVVVPQGGWSLVWCDGNNNVSAGPNTSLFSTQMLLPDGSLSAPGIAFASEPALGFRRAGYATGTLTNPFTTTSGSPTVTVTHTAHGLSNNDTAAFSGASAVGGLTINGQYPVTVLNANSYTINAGSNATSAATGGGAVTYQYMMAAASGGAVSISKSGVAIAHVSPYGILLRGVLSVSGAAQIGGNASVGGNATVAGTLSIVGALSAAAATLTGLLTGVAATLSDILTLSSTSHMVLPGGTAAQRPASPAAANFRYNADTNSVEFYNGFVWKSLTSIFPPPASFKNLSIKVLTNTTVAVTADYVTTTDGSNFQTTPVSSTVNLATTGPDALDTGTIAIDTWYAIHVITKPDGTTKCVASTSFTSPVLPSGYTGSARIGAVRTAHASAQLFGTWQFGRKVQYVVGLAQTATLPVIGDKNSSQGTWSGTAPSYVTLSVSQVVPPTASEIGIIVSTQLGIISAEDVVVAPNTSYLGGESVCPPPVAVNSSLLTANAWMTLEGTTIAWATSGAGPGVVCLGWVDNI